MQTYLTHAYVWLLLIRFAKSDQTENCNYVYKEKLKFAFFGRFSVLLCFAESRQTKNWSFPCPKIARYVSDSDSDLET